jgi:hypothetical protein
MNVFWKILLSELLFLATTRLGLGQGQLVVSPAALTFTSTSGGQGTVVLVQREMESGRSLLASI